MKLLNLTPRADWIEKIRAAGCANPVYESDDGSSHNDWEESRAYSFTSLEIQRLKDATASVTDALMATVDAALNNSHVMDLMGIPPQTQKLMLNSWKAKHRNLAMRFDWSFGGSTPKLLEANVDAMHGYVLGGPAQLGWLAEVFPDKNQWNDIELCLEKAFRNIGVKRVGISAAAGDQAMINEAQLLLKMAKKAGLDASYLDLEQIGYNRTENVYTDVDNSIFEGLVTMMGIGDIVDTEFAEPWFSNSPPKGIFYEPLWVLGLSSKASLAWLWDQNPDHPNLLPTFLEVDERVEQLGDTYVRKPFWGEDGANIQFVENGEVTLVQKDALASTPHESEWVRQAYCPLPSFDGHRPLVSTWVIGGQPAGLSIREGGAITDYFSPVVPHMIEY